MSPVPFMMATSAAAADRLLSLGTLGLVIVVIYFVVVFAIGFYPERFASTGESFCMAGSDGGGKFGVEGVPVTLAPGVRVTSASVSARFAPAVFNPAHTRYIARSEKAGPMALNMHSGWWSVVVYVLVTAVVGLFTRPKPHHELRNLVMGLTPLPDVGPCARYESPKLRAAAIVAALVAVNVIFWQGTVTNSRLSIWSFIGVLLLVYGVLITGAGIYGLAHPPEVKLAWLHAGLWWGLLLVVIGGVYTHVFFQARRARQRGSDADARR